MTLAHRRSARGHSIDPGARSQEISSRVEHRYTACLAPGRAANRRYNLRISAKIMRNCAPVNLLHPYTRWLPAMLVATLILDGGCGASKDLGDTDEAVSEGAASSGGDGPAVTNETTASTVPETATDSTSGTSNAEAGAADESGASDVADGCAAYCEQFTECDTGKEPSEPPGSDLPVDPCVEECIGDFAGEGSCATANVTLLECLAEMTCDEFAGDDWGHCGGAAKAQGEACGVDHCNVIASGELGGTSCTIELMCAGEPPQRTECDEDVCVCFEDGVEIGSCEASAMTCEPPTDPAGIDAIVTWTIDCCEF